MVLIAGAGAARSMSKTMCWVKREDWESMRRTVQPSVRRRAVKRSRIGSGVPSMPGIRRTRPRAGEAGAVDEGGGAFETDLGAGVFTEESAGVGEVLLGRVADAGVDTDERGLGRQRADDALGVGVRAGRNAGRPGKSGGRCGSRCWCRC